MKEKKMFALILGTIFKKGEVWKSFEKKEVWKNIKDRKVIFYFRLDCFLVLISKKFGPQSHEK